MNVLSISNFKENSKITLPCVHCMIKLHNGKLAIGNDTNIIIYNYRTIKKEIRLEYFSKPFYIAEKEIKKLISTYEDKSIIIWNISNTLPICEHKYSFCYEIFFFE